ncbi:hypothetical protein SK128_017689, partial [Halocaridina rubra]
SPIIHRPRGVSSAQSLPLCSSGPCPGHRMPSLSCCPSSWILNLLRLWWPRSPLSFARSQRVSIRIYTDSVYPPSG